VRAFAYLDANSGSLIVSVIAAGGAGAAVAAKMGMQRLKKPFSRRTPDETTGAETETEPETEAASEPVAEDA
jgi:hypothetical protein